MGADELDTLIEALDEGQEAAPPKSKGKQDEFQKFLKTWGKVLNQGFKPEGFDQLIVTGLPSFDVAMGVGGLPAGCVVSVYGPEGAGKTAFWQYIAGKVQAQFPNRIVVIIDAESRFNAPMARRNGMNLSKELFDSHKIMYFNPTIVNGLSIEKTITMFEQLIPASLDGVFMIIDSWDALPTMGEMELDADDGGVKYGGLAKTGSNVLRRLSGVVKQSNSTLLIIHQLRDKVGGMGYGPQTDTSGGHAPKHYASVRYRLTPIKTISNKTTGEVYGKRIQGKFDKNLYSESGPGTEFEFDLRYGPDGGIDIPGDLIDMAVEVGLASKTDQGNYTFSTITNEEGQAIRFRGRDTGRLSLAEKPELQQELYNQILAALSNQEAANGE